ncbi:glycolate oxidase subunit GlcE [Brucella intermedia]|uniref:Glycolate oxidase FAD binding subunit n=4 Tax=Brucella intermedia TaxID=94625 RepID=A0ABR6ALW3_9HYPH|nr:glycolate oxidase subunit GlcE [Brucella intermedia]EEQ93156.1 FAD linked oxidase domain-containing protein [Brucella intermedia LMG 3301]ELT47625.1 FAD linked oxidase domain-containing protein [Brucella intermedia M86]KAB2694866.1 glycolate oxidase subunit GlcE [Brucella intermedia]KAB2708735.1 glycolate oxidase subunit GlcE [Brucella intermedia]KAB2711160.1 glycolate oxidase subunit GlcE [Brucella intermedia]
MSDRTILKPQDEAGVVDAVQEALAGSTPLEIIGHGSKRGIGHRVDAGHVLDVSELKGVTLYEPDELVLSAKAGTPMAVIEKLLSDNDQCFHFEPMDYGPLLSGESGRGTIGGALAANLSGPRRLKAGAARDHVLGVRVVSGRGELFKSGGRVVKNVTGYDLSKGMANSWGTLGVATEVTFKVLPKPETAATLAVRGLTDEQAVRAMAMAMGSREEVASAAHLPPTVANRFLDGKLGWEAATVLRLEGFAPSVEHRSRQLQALLGGVVDVLNEAQSHQLWREVRDVLPYANAGDNRAVWRVSMAPMLGWCMVDEFRRYAGVDAFYDWQGGLIWMRMEADPEAQTLRQLIAKYGGGHATLVRAPESVRSSVEVFEPQPAALAALSQRLKHQFDPENILNPGRMHPRQAGA